MTRNYLPRGTLPDYVFLLTQLEQDECVLWPFSDPSKYGPIGINGKTTHVHVLACERRNGPKPEGKTDVAHSCGVRGCLNYRHLRWATRKENMADTIAHGTRRYGETCGTSYLTGEQVDEIRRLIPTGMLQKDVAAMFGTTASNVGAIVAGKSWRHRLTPSPDDV